MRKSRSYQFHKSPRGPLLEWRSWQSCSCQTTALEIGSSRSETGCAAGALFNRGKALDMLGRAAEAQAAYAEAARKANGISAAKGSYAKAFAALKQLSEEQARAALQDDVRSSRTATQRVDWVKQGWRGACACAASGRHFALCVGFS